MDWTMDDNMVDGLFLSATLRPQTGLQVWLFFNSFIFFNFEKRPKEIWLLSTFFGQSDFLCRFDRFKEGFGRFLALEDF